MRSRIGVRAACFVLLASSLAARPAAANLVTNGSFEVSPAPAGTVLLAPGSTALAPWAISRGNVECVGPTAWSASDGNCSIALNGSTAGGVSQAFSTVPGGLYGVSFALAGDPHSGVHQVRVAAAGVSQDFSFDTAPAWEWAMGWTSKTWQFTAVSNPTTIELYSLDAASDVGPAVDNVDVEVLSLLGTGDAGVRFALAPVAPNPVTASTLVAWSLPRAAPARLAVFDVRGREVSVLAEGPQSAGSHAVRWDASGAASGIYLLRLESGGQALVRRIAVVR